MTTRYSSGDWDFGSDTLAAEVAAMGPGRHVGDRRHIDEVTDGALVAIHCFTWDGDRWVPGVVPPEGLDSN